MVRLHSPQVSQKGFTTIQILVAFLFTAGVGFLIFTKTAINPSKSTKPYLPTQTPASQATPGLTPSPTPVSDKVKNPDLPAVKYKFYGGVDKIYNERARSIASVFVNKSEPLPKSIILDGSTITINKWEIYQVEKGFGAYAYIETDGKEGKVGFWYSEGGIPNPAYGGVLSFETRKWTDPPTEEERKQGIRGTYHVESTNLIGIDYNLSTNEWGFVQLDKSLYTEKLLPLKFL